MFDMFELLKRFHLVMLGVFCVTTLTGAWFETCDHEVKLGPNGRIYINSPRYPNTYVPGTSCRYRVIAPVDYEMYVQCNVSFYSEGPQCTTEQFYISTEGMETLEGSEYFCGNGFIKRNSLFNRLTLAYTSSSYYRSGRFSCYIRASQQKCDCGWSVRTKIVGGVEAKPNEFPFIVGLVYAPAKQVYCGGVIITHRYVLTAAHCLSAHKNPDEIGVLVGDHDLSIGSDSPYTDLYRVTELISHEGYNSTVDINDIGLVKTVKDIQWSRGVGPVCLPYYYSQTSFAGSYVDIAGWGTTDFAGPTSQVLLKATVMVTSNQECQKYYPHILNSHVCTYYPQTDSCQYDSGGPVIFRYYRMYSVGIISFGYACNTGKPSVNTRITSYLDWIEEKTNSLFCTP